ncbi:MAG TPA: hypothetical protein VIM69_13145, partial [Opitutaceae bacterium]
PIGFKNRQEIFPENLPKPARESQIMDVIDEREVVPKPKKALDGIVETKQGENGYDCDRRIKCTRIQSAVHLCILLR